MENGTIRDYEPVVSVVGTLLLGSSIGIRVWTWYQIEYTPPTNMEGPDSHPAIGKTNNTPGFQLPPSHAPSKLST